MSHSQPPVHLAIDLGASGGRVLAGSITYAGITLEDVHRFENGPHQVGNRLVWNLVGIWEHIQAGLRKSASKYGDRIRSIGASTWGVDYVLVDRNDDLVGSAVCYRDRRTQNVMSRAFEKVSRDEFFARTGLQFMELNTAYQLYSMRLEDSPLLDIAERFLMIPDFIHWQLSGQKCNEFTNASTTQLLDPTTRTWSQPLIDALDLPQRIFAPPLEPATAFGKISSQCAVQTQLAPQVEVILPATHDTGSAVLAVPAKSFAQDQPDWCYISCGTWSLMGVELARPNLTKDCQRYNFTNEGGVGGSVRLLKNISGLWMAQQCRAKWRSQGCDFAWPQLLELAGRAPSMVSLVDPDDPMFVSPDDMPDAIRQFCKRTSQNIPKSEGEVIRCALESLALRYRLVLEMLEQLVGNSLNTIHIVGGGVQNTMLCQFAANACRRQVIAGPVEATALGNVMMQAVGLGRVANVEQARQIVGRQVDIRAYEPESHAGSIDAWNRGVEKMRGLTLR